MKHYQYLNSLSNHHIEIIKRLKYIEQIPFLKRLHKNIRLELAKLLIKKIYHLNDIIIDIHDEHDQDLYMIIHGHVSIYDAQGTFLNHLQDEDYFGERSLLYAVKRTATVQVKSNICTCYKLAKASYQSVLGGLGLTNAASDAAEGVTGVTQQQQQHDDELSQELSAISLLSTFFHHANVIQQQQFIKQLKEVFYPLNQLIIAYQSIVKKQMHIIRSGQVRITFYNKNKKKAAYSKILQKKVIILVMKCFKSLRNLRKKKPLKKKKRILNQKKKKKRNFYGYQVQCISQQGVHLLILHENTYHTYIVQADNKPPNYVELLKRITLLAHHFTDDEQYQLLAKQGITQLQSNKSLKILKKKGQLLSSCYFIQSGYVLFKNEALQVIKRLEANQYFAESILNENHIAQLHIEYQGTLLQIDAAVYQRIKGYKYRNISQFIDQFYEDEVKVKERQKPPCHMMMMMMIEKVR